MIEKSQLAQPQNLDQDVVTSSEKPASIKDHLSRSSDYLDKVRVGGKWQTFKSRRTGWALDWPTAYIVNILASNDLMNTSSVYEIIEVLHSDQKSDGGWGYNSNVPGDSDSTAIAITTLCNLGIRSEVARALDFLLTHRDPSTGGFRTFVPEVFAKVANWRSDSVAGWSQPLSEITATSSMAIKAAADLDLIDRALSEDILLGSAEFMRKTQLEDGSWHCYWWSNDTYATSKSAIALHEIDKENAETQRVVKKAGEWLFSSISIKDPFYKALAILALIKTNQIEGRLNEIATAVNQLLDMMKADGSWQGADLLQLPEIGDVEPWKSGKLRHENFFDQGGVFTTATCIEALSEWFKRSTNPPHGGRRT